MGNPETAATDTVAELKRISAIRMQMLEMHPFWGYLLLQMKFVAACDLPSFSATDCIRHIWFNPEKTRHLTIPQLGFVLAHEVGHQIFMTDKRRGSRNLLRWNMATDHAINHIVAKIPNPSNWDYPLYNFRNVVLPEVGPVNILMRSEYAGKIAEVIYEDLCQKDIEVPVILEFTLPLNCNEATNASGTENESESDNQPSKHKSMDHGGFIDIHLPGNLDDDQCEMLKERIRAAVGAWEECDRRGECPHNVLASLELLDKPQIPWRRVLHRFIDQALAKDDYSLTRPNKRYLQEDFIVPGRYGEKVSSIVVALDSSGSMSKEILTKVCRELKGLLPYAENMMLIVADAKIHDVVPFDQIDRYLEVGQVRGGGGTDHRPVFNHIVKERLMPKLFVGLTDLISNFPVKAPPYPVIWIAPAKSKARAPWGKTIRIDR